MRSTLLALLLAVAAPAACAEELPRLLEEALNQVQSRPWMRARSLPAFARLGAQAPAAARLLVEGFPTRLESGQVASLQLLGALGRPESFPFLLALSRDAQQTVLVRRAAILALESYADRRAVLPLLDTLADGDPALQQAATSVLRPWARDPLVAHRARDLARHASAPVRRHTVELLAHSNDPGTAGLVRAALRDPAPEVRAAACRAAGQRRLDGALALLRKALAEGSDEEKIAAVQGLAHLGTAAAPAAEELWRVLDRADADPYLRATVPGALVAITPHDERLARRLDAHSADPSTIVRQSCKVALYTLRRKGGIR